MVKSVGRSGARGQVETTDSKRFAHSPELMTPISNALCATQAVLLCFLDKIAAVLHP